MYLINEGNHRPPSRLVSDAVRGCSSVAVVYAAINNDASRLADRLIAGAPHGGSGDGDKRPRRRLTAGVSRR